MATCDSGVKEDVPVVLRVKRKRTEDPVEALVIASKIPKHDDETQTQDELPSSNSHSSSCVFQLCGSISDTAEAPDKSTAIMDVVKSFKTRSKINPLAHLSLTQIKEVNRQERKTSSSIQRYKLMASKRSALSIDKDATFPSDVIHLYDAVNEEDDSMEDNCVSKSSITCNGASMTREKVIPAAGSDEFVIDVYYSGSVHMDTLDNVSGEVYVCPYEGVELVHDIIPSDDEDNLVYEDEDDSNDENNWRNEYPDEEDWRNSNDDSYNESDGYEEDDFSLYRNMAITYYDEYGNDQLSSNDGDLDDDDYT